MDEHPDWEAKWSNDREKARARAGYPPLGEAELKPKVQPVESVTIMENNEGDDGAKSIRIQMRNFVKVEENRMASWNANTNAAPPSKKDTAVDEWMDKPAKVKLDIDTQKFAAIVRQKHGNKDKDKDENGGSAVKRSSPAASVPHRNDREREPERERDRGGKDNDVGRRTDARRYGVEMSFNKERDRDRDRYGGRGRRRYLVLKFCKSLFL